jgi:DNA invertase Pin-like site-specific DNA recombinase
MGQCAPDRPKAYAGLRSLAIFIPLDFSSSLSAKAGRVAGEKFPNMNDPNNDSEFAVIYGRVSTNNQRGSLDLQETRAVEYTAECGFPLHRVSGGLFLDEAVSGGKPFHDRPAAQRLLAALKTHPEIKHFIIAKIDRLDRTTLSGLKVVKELKEIGVKIHILDFMGRGRLRTDDADQMAFFSMHLVFAELELAKITERIRERVDANFENFLLIGTEPYGWKAAQCGTRFDKYNNKEKPVYRLEPHPDEWQIVMRMDRQRRAGCSHNEIAQQLNLDGIPTKLPKGTRIKLRRARDGQPEVWGLSSGRWQAMQVMTILDSRHTARLLATTKDGSQAA